MERQKPYVIDRVPFEKLDISCQKDYWKILRYITSDKIDAGAVIAGKIAANAASIDNVQYNAITTDKINVNAVTFDKIQSKFLFNDK